jgi:MIP family channel proteins
MNVRALVAEAVGTFILVGVGSLSVISALVAAQGSSTFILLVVPFGFGFGLLAAIAVGGHVSGGHFNPAVTLAAVLDRRVEIVTGIAYLVAQVVGALAASLTILLLTSREFVSATRNTPGLTDWPTFATEVILTAVFVAVILTITRTHPTHAVFVIPITLLVIHFASIPLSGASVNPVRSLAPAIVAGDYTALWIYLTAPFVGAIIGWAVYWFLTPPGEPIPGVAEVDLEGEEGLDDYDESDEMDELDDDDLDDDDHDDREAARRR